MLEADENWANLEGKGTASTEMNDLEAMLSASQPVLTQELLVEDLSTPIPNTIDHALAQDMEVLSSVSAGKNFRNYDLKRVKKKRDRLPEEVNTYKMEKGELEKTFLGK